MKKVLFLIFASLLVLGACGQDGDKSNKESVNEDKPQFKNDTLVLDQAVLYIKDAFIVKNKDTGKKEIAFKYEVKNKTDKEEITPGNVWSAGVEVKQDENNTNSSLDTGTTIVSGGKYKEWLEHNDDSVKKGKTAKGLATYELKNDNKVTLHFSQGAGGKDLGSKQYDLSKLKTVDYSTEEDLASAQNSDDITSDDTTSKESQSTSKNDNGKAQDNNGNNDRTQGKQVQTAQSNNQQQNNNQQSEQQDPNSPSYQEYLNAKKLTENIQNNPDKYQHIGGGPGMALSNPNQSYDSFKQDVTKARNESEVVQQ